MRLLAPPWTQAILLSLLVTGAVSKGINYTIDDQVGDGLTGIKPVYSPPSAWQQAYKSADRATHNSESKSLLGGPTWHYVQYLAAAPQVYSMTVQFNGTAIYVYNIIANNASANAFSTTNLTFYLDGDRVGRFVHVPAPDCDGFQYDVMVYMNQSMADTIHTFTMRAAGPTNSLILFDYIVYTSGDLADDDPETSLRDREPDPSVAESASPSRLIVIIGTVIGGLLVLIVVVFLLLFLSTRFRRAAGSALLKDVTNDSTDSIEYILHASLKDESSVDVDAVPYPVANDIPTVALPYSLLAGHPPEYGRFPCSLPESVPPPTPPPSPATHAPTAVRKHAPSINDVQSSISLPCPAPELSQRPPTTDCIANADLNAQLAALRQDVIQMQAQVAHIQEPDAPPQYMETAESRRCSVSHSVTRQTILERASCPPPPQQK